MLSYSSHFHRPNIPSTHITDYSCECPQTSSHVDVREHTQEHKVHAFTIGSLSFQQSGLDLADSDSRVYEHSNATILLMLGLVGH